MYSITIKNQQEKYSKNFNNSHYLYYVYYRPGMLNNVMNEIIL